MSKFDELKAKAQAATEIIGKTHPEIEAATAAFKQIVTPGAVAELLAIQAQLVEALSAICNMQQRNFGDGIATHIALISLSDDGRTALAVAEAQP